MKRVFFVAVFAQILITLFFVSCENDRYGYKYSLGEFPIIPVNFEDLNTEYDDYNAAAPTEGGAFEFLFSSNRNTKGGNFDIVYKWVEIIFSKSDGKLSIKAYDIEDYLDEFWYNTRRYYTHNALPKINTLSNEMGPYLIPLGSIEGHNPNYIHSSLLLYSSNNDSGFHDILFTHNRGSYYPTENYIDPVKVKYLNSDFDDMYPTFNKNRSEIYFSSNRESNFSIYKVSVNNRINVIDVLSQDSDINVEKVNVLSSDYDDTCPYIIGDLMVFASNRPGGYGGYDLYYSENIDGEWQPPVNFGSNINTEYDEFRPIIRSERGFKNDLMFFSSNRIGGKGGFDLYYIGIDKIIGVEY